MKLSDNLKRIRKENNLSQEQLAEKLGVSRQAVSKWESGQSYPEMDKVLLICKLFNYNIDELMNENVKEVNENKQSKININKYIDDFFEFITKTVDCLSYMKFGQKIKMLIEQIGIGFFLFLIFLIIGAIGSSIVSGIFRSIMPNGYYIIREIFSSIYIAIALVLGIIILLHIFKIRYLDYFEIIKEDSDKEKDNNNLEEKNNYDEKKKIFIEKNKEKIIIRDPNHSQSRFLSGIFRIIVWTIKFIAICTALLFILSFVSFICLLVLSFLFIKTGMLFMGVFLGLISLIIMNFIVLELFYNFIMNKKTKKTKTAIVFLSSLVIAGISIGLILIGMTNFNINNSNSNNTIEEVYEYKMTDNLSIENWNGFLEYIEEDSNNITIIIKHSKYFKSNITDSNNQIEIYSYQDESKFIELIRDYIRDINNKEIKDFSIPEVNVYASKENIEKIRQNLQNKYFEQQKQEDLHNKINIMEDKINDLENQIVNKDLIIDSLERQIQNTEDLIVY